jgi:hypothetical protein
MEQYSQLSFYIRHNMYSHPFHWSLSTWTVRTKPKLPRFSALRIVKKGKREIEIYFYSNQCLTLVLIDQQSVGKRTLHLMDTVNAKKRWTTIYWRVNKFLKESHVVPRLAKERASVLKINDISFFGTPDWHHFCSIT